MTSQSYKNQSCQDANSLVKTEECTPANTSSPSIIVTAILPSSTQISVNTTPNTSLSTLLRLDNGQFAAQPNNRVLWRDSSLTPADLKRPDFKVCTQNYAVEDQPKWSVGHTDEWQYKTKEEENS